MDAPRSPDSLIHVLGTLTALAFAACVTRALLAALFRAIGPDRRSPSETSVEKAVEDDRPATSAHEPSVRGPTSEARPSPRAPLSAASGLFAFAVVSGAVSLILLGSASGLTSSSGVWILVALPLVLSLIVPFRPLRLRSRWVDGFALAAPRARSPEPRVEDARP